MREVLSDLDTPLSVYLKLADAPNAYLFESVEGGETWGRYSITGHGLTVGYAAGIPPSDDYDPPFPCPTLDRVEIEVAGPVTVDAEGLMSHAVVMLTGLEKLFTALSVMLAIVWLAPELTVTVNDVFLTALSETVSMFDWRPACAAAVAANTVSAAAETERVRSRIIQPQPGERVNRGAAVLSRHQCAGAHLPD